MAQAMTKYQIAVVVGSLRRESFNRKLADAVIALAPPEFAFRHLRIDNLPLYNQDDDNNPSEAVQQLKAQIQVIEWAAVCHTGVQPFNSGGAQECA